MKLIHIPFCYWPDPVGGTEVYVDSLAREQQRRGSDVLVAAPGAQSESYWRCGVKVRRFPVSESVADVAEMYGEGGLTAASSFGRILDEESPDLVHLHAFTRGVSVRLVREAKRRGIPVVFSYHTPTVSCPRGTLLRWGTEICDGVLEPATCAKCVLRSKGLGPIVSTALGSLPASIGRGLGALGAPGRLWTAARMTELMEIRRRAFRSLMNEVDHVIALCRWVKDVLLRNGVPEHKITVSYQGLDSTEPPARNSLPSVPPLRIAFLGRLDPTKGLDILIRALRLMPELPVELDVFTVIQGPSGDRYRAELLALAGEDRRICFRPPIPSNEVIARLAEYHVLAVPSQWLETGPRVVLEAFAARTPVLGSNLGGVADLVGHAVNGLLVEPKVTEKWAASIRTLCEKPDLVDSLRRGISPPRRVDEVAEEMDNRYRALVQQTSQAAVCTPVV